MPDERDIQAAESALTARRVREHATEREWTSLVWASLKRAGVNLLELTEQAERERNGKPVPNLPFDPEALATLSARVRLRSKLGLPRSECVVPDPPPEADHCECLSETLDARATSTKPPTRAAVLRAARRSHRERWAWLKRRPEPHPEPSVREFKPPKPATQVATAPKREVLETNTRPARIVRRRRRWYDRDDGIMNRQF